MPFQTILTDIGQTKIAAAVSGGGTVNISQGAVGDGGGAATNPQSSDTALVNETSARVSINLIEASGNQITVEFVIPGEDGGYTIREAAVFDSDGDMILVANVPDSAKPAPGDGGLKQYICRMVATVQDSSVVNVTVDTNTVVATRGWVSSGFISVNDGAELEDIYANLSGKYIAASNIWPTTAAALSDGVGATANLVGGSGGTDGTFDLIFTGGGGTGAAGVFTVSGGALTSIFITYPGYSYTSAPTLDFSNSAGLTGASADAVLAENSSDTEYFGVPSSNDAESIILYRNDAGVATEIKAYPTSEPVAQNSENTFVTQSTSPYDIIYANDFTQNAANVNNFNGGTHTLDTGNGEIEVTASSASRGVSIGPDLVNGENYIVFIKHRDGTAGANLYSRWANVLVAGLPDGWTKAEFTADGGGGFGNDITVAADGAGNFYIEAIIILRDAARPHAFAREYLEDAALQWDYEEDFSTSINPIGNFGSPAGAVSNGQWIASPTTDATLYTAGPTVEVGEWLEVIADIVITGSKPIEFRPYWANTITGSFAGSNYLAETTGVHHFYLKGDGTRSATAALQKLVFHTLDDNTGGTITLNSLKIRKVPAVTRPRSRDFIEGIENTLNSGLTAGKGYILLGSENVVGGHPDSVMIGCSMLVDAVPAYGASFTDGVVAVGTYTIVHNGRCVAVGHHAGAHSVSATAVGALTSAWQSHDVALGRGAHTLQTAADGGNVCLGSATNLDCYLASGISHRWTEAGTGTVQTVTPSSVEVTYHGHDAFDDVDGTQTSVAGGDLVLAGGRGTGVADGGSVTIKVARAGVSDNNTKNALVKVVEFDTDNTADQTAMLLWADGSVKRVKVGAPDSGGTGFRALVIDN